MEDTQKVTGDEALRATLAGLPLFVGPLRVKVTLEREDGTELLHAYLPRTVRFGDQVEMKFTAGEIS
jgi:hypothetical protein